MEKYALEQSDITEENISGTISGEMRTNAILSVIIAGIFIMIYIWVRFRDIKFGAGAIIAVLHDVQMCIRDRHEEDHLCDRRNLYLCRFRQHGCSCFCRQ